MPESVLQLFQWMSLLQDADRSRKTSRAGLQVNVPGFAFEDGLFRMQLRQLAPDVVRDVVVRFVESVLSEILYTHKRNSEAATTRFDETRALPIELWPREHCWSHRDSNPEPRA
jgi:hypothetical protein